MMIDGLDDDDCDDNDLNMQVPAGDNDEEDESEDDDCNDNDLSIQVRFQWETHRRDVSEDEYFDDNDLNGSNGR